MELLRAEVLQCAWNAKWNRGVVESSRCAWNSYNINTVRMGLLECAQWGRQGARGVVKVRMDLLEYAWSPINAHGTATLLALPHTVHAI